jgi:DNA-3-methyladenine glycosylase II
MNRQPRIIEPVGAFDFDRALAYLRTWKAATFERVDAAGTYRRALRLDGHDVLLSVRAGERGQLLLEVTGDALADATLGAAERVVRRVFALDHDPAPFLALSAGDPALAPLAALLAGLRPVAIPDLYETLLWAILGQQINVTFARALKLRLVELCGRAIAVDSARYPLLPLPEDVAALDPAELVERQFSRQKAAYVIGLSEAVATGDLDLAAVTRLPAEEAIAELTRYKGVGRWTAEYVLMRGAGHPDVLPAGDVSLQLLIGTALLGRRAIEAELREATARWSPWRGWAAFSFWAARQFGA